MAYFCVDDFKEHCSFEGVVSVSFVVATDVNFTDIIDSIHKNKNCVLGWNTSLTHPVSGHTITDEDTFYIKCKVHSLTYESDWITRKVEPVTGKRINIKNKGKIVSCIEHMSDGTHNIIW